MKADDGRRLCQEAQLYYYDLLCPDGAAVPESVSRHVSTCPACQEQVRRLREALLETQRESDPMGSCEDETVEALAQQFQFLDERVTCSEAKPFLPELAKASPQIRIPTPVTVHVEHCPECAEDLATIRAMNLTGGQLKRLSRIFESGSGAGVSPLQLRMGSFPPVPVENIKLVCADVSTADIFDLVVSCGAAPAEGHHMPNTRQRAVASHVQACPACAGRIQTLHHTLTGILERADSETTTIYHAGNDAEDAQGKAEGTYRYPVSVEVLHDQSGSEADPSGSGTAEIACASRFEGSPRLLARIAGITVIGVALAMLVRPPALTASGTLVSDVLKAFAKAQNIHVVTTYPNAGSVQELWIARHSGRLANRTAQKCVLHDLGHHRTRTIDLQAGSDVSAKLNRVKRDQIGQFTATFLADAMERVSPNTRLQQPTDDIGAGTPEALDVYELESTPHTGNSPLSKRCLIYIDPATKLPQRMEHYRQGPRQSQWEIVTTIVFAYPTEQETNDAIQALFPVK